MEKTFTVVANSGVSARVATTLVQKANRFDSDIKLKYKEKTVDLKSIMGLMSLGISGNCKFTIVAFGSDENQAI